MNVLNIVDCKWFQHIISVLNHLGLGFVWLSQGIGINKIWLKNIVTQIQSDQFKQNWSSEVFDSSKCSIYRCFKTEPCFEGYLNVLPTKLEDNIYSI